MKMKIAAAAPGPMRAVTTSVAPDRMRKTPPVKPMGVSGTLHSPLHGRSVAAQQASRHARRDRVVLEHLPLVKAIAVRVHENLPVHVDLDDLVHAGILGLFDAASKYNPEKQVVFSSYAKHRIKGAILDSLRQLDWASRDLRRRHKQVEAATRDLSAQFERQPTEAELAEKMGVEVGRWRQMVVELRTVGLISASGRGNERENGPAPEFPAKQEFQPDCMCAQEELRGM